MKAQNQNSPNSWVRHELYVDMVHDFQLASVLPSAQLSIKKIKQFIEEVFDGYPKKEIVLNDEEQKLLKMIDSHLSV